METLSRSGPAWTEFNDYSVTRRLRPIRTIPPARTNPVASSAMLLGSGALTGLQLGFRYEHGSGLGFGFEYVGPTATTVSRTATTTFFMGVYSPPQE
jgi:hypothetical protein